MPAQRVYQPRGSEDKLTISVEGDLESRTYRRGYKSIYFTDQSPCFTIIVENESEDTITGKLPVRVSFDQSSDEYERLEAKGLEIEVEPSKTERYSYQLEMLSYQGSAAVSIPSRSGLGIEMMV